MYNAQAYKRCKVDGEGILTSELGDTRLRLIDVSAADAIVTVPKKLRIDARYKIQLAFEISLVPMQFEGKALVLRLLEEYGGQYVYEILFVSLNDKIRVEIDEMVNHCYFPEEASGFGFLN